MYLWDATPWRDGQVLKDPPPAVFFEDFGDNALVKLAPVHLESVRAALIDHVTREELVAQGEVMRRVVRATRHRDDEALDAV